MNEKTYSLQGINDFIGDAISDDELSAKRIANSLKRELSELVSYHEDSATKCRELLKELGGVPESDTLGVSDFFPPSSYHFPDYLNFSPSSRNLDTITL